MPTSESEQYTEVELRGTLVAIADREEPDLDAFRMRMTAAESAAGSGADGDSFSAVVEIGATHDAADVRSRRGRRIVTAKALAIAACIAVVLVVAGVALGLNRDGSSHHPNDPAVSVPTPHGLVPGAVTLKRYSGVGPAVIAVPRYTVPVHYEIAAVVNCRGSGGIRLSTGVSAPSCDGGIGGSFPTTVRKLRVTVRAATAWRLSLVREPKIRTNGSVQSPVDPEFAHPDRFELGRGSGDGNGVVSLESPPENNPHAQIVLTCHGSGVTLSGGSSSLFKTLYTHTCFAGSEYVFDVTKFAVPTILNVTAQAGTTWHLIVRPN